MEKKLITISKHPLKFNYYVTDDFGLVIDFD